MLKKRSLPFIAFLQATALAVYIVLISLFFNLISPAFSGSSTQFYAPIIMLLLFVFSAVISGVTILGKAGVLFWEKKYKESFILLGWTVGWGFFYFALFLTFLYNTK